MRKRWTRDELRRLIETGNHDLERYELFDGDLFDKMGKNSPHVIAVHQTNYRLRQIFGYHFVWSKSPINLRPEDNATYRPEPDVAVLRHKRTITHEGDPDPADVVLVVEVSDSTLCFDLNAKGPAYARAGIPEYWVLDVLGRELVRHTRPAPDGYLTIERLGENDWVTPLAAPESPTLVSTLFDVGE